MKKFDQPMMAVIEDSMLEPVYASSGVVPSIPLIPATPTGDVVITTEWCNHNSGSHSEIKINITIKKQSGDNISMSFHIPDFKLNGLTPGDGCLIASNVSEHGFTLNRVGRHFNPGENIAFVMQLTAKKDDGTVGAVGKTGDYMPCEVVCTGFSIS